MRRTICALLVMKPSHCPTLVERLEAAGVEVFLMASTRTQACQMLAAGVPIQMVLTSEELPDGKWRDVLRDVKQTGAATPLVVCVRRRKSQSLAAAGGNGVHELLAQPCEQREVQRIVQLAALEDRPRHPARRGGPEAPAARREAA